MAKSKLPDPLAKRHLLEADLDPAKAKALADGYLALGREIEAIDFLKQAKAIDGLEALEAAALERGDVFLMRKVSQALGRDPSSERWRALAAAAERAGRLRDAESAVRLAAVDA
ncbi:MAG: hypothetical protein IPK00_03560 [Deltaproteobacteria bacterium]|nr:hypothetical protein [Deltaproteobacteria bacterium]